MQTSLAILHKVQHMVQQSIKLQLMHSQIQNNILILSVIFLNNALVLQNAIPHKKVIFFVGTKINLIKKN